MESMGTAWRTLWNSGSTAPARAGWGCQGAAKPDARPPAPPGPGTGGRTRHPAPAAHPSVVGMGQAMKRLTPLRRLLSEMRQHLGGRVTCGGGPAGGRVGGQVGEGDMAKQSAESEAEEGQVITGRPSRTSWGHPATWASTASLAHRPCLHSAGSGTVAKTTVWTQDHQHASMARQETAADVAGRGAPSRPNRPACQAKDAARATELPAAMSRSASWAYSCASSRSMAANPSGVTAHAGCWKRNSDAD